MAEPEAGAGAHIHRRHRRIERKKTRLRRVAAVVAAIVVAGGFLFVAFDLVRLGATDTPSLAGTVAPAAGPQVPVAPDSTVAGAHCRPLSVDDPLRLWVAGDSLAGSLGPSLGTIAGKTGVVQPYFDSRVSSGLSNPGFFNWPDHGTSELARISPEIVVFIIGTNDYAAVSGDGWKTDYARQVEAMVKILASGGRTVYWVGAPILEDQKKNDAVVQVNAVTADVLKGHPDVHYVDAYKLFSSTDGTFSQNLADETGKVVTMRAGDGVHFTTDGGDYLARAVFKLVDAQCRVTAQKVAGAAKETIETEGSTQVAPGSQSGPSTGGSAVSTTPPAPAPSSTTRPPVASTPPTTTTPTPTTTTIAAPHSP
jgi:hypothetical protein